MARRSLRLELIATLAVILMMAVVSLSLANEVLGSRRHAAQTTQELHQHARGLATLAAPLVGGAVARTADLEQALRPSIGSLGIEAIEVHRIDDTGAPAIVSLGLAGPLPPPQPVPGPDGASFVEGTMVVVDHRIRTFGGQNAPTVLRVIARASPWTRVGDWREVGILALGVGAVLLVLGILLVEHQVLRPLARVRAAVGQVALGNLAAEIPEEGPAELQSLAGSFNTMTAALRARLREIEAQRERLVRAEQLASVGRIAAGTAHEVGNPLAAILGYVELLLDPRASPPLNAEQRSLLERSRAQIQRIQGIVGQLLDYSRPPSETMGEIEVVASTTQLLSLLRHDARCKDVELTVEGDEQARARGDAALLDQVLQNLVINGARAAVAAGESPKVGLRIAAIAGGGASIEVQDSGRGVPDEARPQLFEPFFSTAKAGEGTGLGLAISQGLVVSMGGTLECLPGSERAPLPGARFPGAVFRVTLPSSDDQAADRAAPSNADGAAPV